MQIKCSFIEASKGLDPYDTCRPYFLLNYPLFIILTVLVVSSFFFFFFFANFLMRLTMLLMCCFSCYFRCSVWFSSLWLKRTCKFLSIAYFSAMRPPTALEHSLECQATKCTEKKNRGNLSHLLFNMWLKVEVILRIMLFLLLCCAKIMMYFIIMHREFNIYLKPSCVIILRDAWQSTNAARQTDPISCFLPSLTAKQVMEWK